MTVGRRIKNRREELGMTQDELALKMGYTSRSSIAKVEADKSDIPQSKLVKFANALNVSPSYLMGWADISGNDIATEEEFISLFRQLTDEQKETVKIVMRSLAK